MPIAINNKVYYSPAETMDLLNLSREMLIYHRRKGNLPGGYRVGLAIYHTKEEIDAAAIAIATPKKRGPKTGKKRQDNEGEGERSSSVTYAPPFSAQNYSEAALGATA